MIILRWFPACKPATQRPPHSRPGPPARHHAPKISERTVERLGGAAGAVGLAGSGMGVGSFETSEPLGVIPGNHVELGPELSQLGAQALLE